jgi:serine/threonine-protein kinase PpkA
MNAVGGYRLERLLARGRQSAVYLAQDARSGRRVAMKLGGREAGLAHEFGVGRSLCGGQLIELYEQGEQGGQAFLAMEYAECGPVGRLPLPLAPSKALSLAAQAAQALAQLHAAGWVHRDVKPANLLLRADGSLALADFGSACRRGEGAHDGRTLVGTPRYAAPEQSRGEAAQPAADIYSLGVVLFEWLAGVPPFNGETATELAAQHLLAPVPSLPAHAAPWQDLINLLLAKDPGRRLADGGAAAAAIALRDPS